MDLPFRDDMERPLFAHLRRQARERPDKPAYIWYGATVSFAELDRASDGFAARLQRIGIGKGDPVALFMGNCPHYPMAQYGAQKIGAVASPCGAMDREHELAAQLSDLGAKVIVVAEPLLPVVRNIRDRTALKHVFVVRYADLLPADPTIAVPEEVRARVDNGPSRPGEEDFLAAARSGETPADVDVDMDDVCLIIYTSGSTGRPKGAMLTYRNAAYKTAASVHCNGLKSDDMLLSIAPLYHIAGMIMGVNVPILSGTSTILLHRFDPLAVLQAIDRYRVSWWYSIAPMNIAVMQHPAVGAHDLSSLRANPVTSFGVDWTEELARQWCAHARACASFEAAYGLSETHTVDTAMPADAVRWGTHGKPVPGTRIRILDPETGREAPPGEQGEIVVRSPGVFAGYRNRPDATAETLRDGWVHTGDMGRMNGDGYLTFIGRFKEMIKVSGYSVFPEQVESILNLHPAVMQSAVVGMAHPTKGEAVKAFIVLRPGAQADAETIIAWARDNMAPYKVPRAIGFLPELPRTPAGKLLRRLLKDAD